MSSLWSCVADLVFPPGCTACGALLESTRPIAFCDSCLSEISFIRQPLCTCCGMPFSSEAGGDHLCGDCIVSGTHFFRARAVGVYEKTLLETIHRFKYNRDLSAGKALGRMMAEHPYPLFSAGDYSLVVPVPLHPGRLRQRGFNQALLLAEEIAAHSSLRLGRDVLRRKVHTAAQVGLGKDERAPNVKGAFTVKRPEAVRGERVLLVDDVYTTGSTVRECARVLMNSEAAEVGVLTAARTV